ncbi:hypothetical protein [Cupriavidus numazuensis]|uniref:hypothetical protein n=1 Tax=Cupriavidus numazuensis TaxID=221992 RepID=UPI001BAD0DBA|nr:hypothetical protein [Cupriavidus numazuensis]
MNGFLSRRWSGNLSAWMVLADMRPAIRPAGLVYRRHDNVIAVEAPAQCRYVSTGGRRDYESAQAGHRCVTVTCAACTACRASETARESTEGLPDSVRIDIGASFF